MRKYIKVLVCSSLWLSLSLGSACAQDVPSPPELSLAFEVLVDVADPTVIGEVRNGTRRIVEIKGGSFKGAKGLKGKVLPGGADWQIIGKDGFTDIDARYTLKTDKGQLIYVSNIGIRHAPPDIIKRLNAGETVDQSQIYFRATPKFETGAPELEWLMKSLFVATGERYPNGVVIRFWQVH